MALAEITESGRRVRMMQYLSVHDLVWINGTIMGTTVDFDYQRLEAAMAAQYSYGVSTNTPEQAANLLEAMVAKKPFDYGNLRTGFVATAAFLDANGYALKPGDSNA